MGFAHGVTVQRSRRQQVTDPMNPARTVPGDWADADSIDLAGAFIAAASSRDSSDATRSLTLTSKSLYLTDVAADVQKGDRIIDSGDTYLVTARPTAERNPFTGWAPVVEVPLELVEG